MSTQPSDRQIRKRVASPATAGVATKTVAIIMSGTIFIISSMPEVPRMGRTGRPGNLGKVPGIT
jgi:hypothetical protein